jgi:hypothetical protein
MSQKIPKEYAYAVTKRRTYNTMATRKRTKRLTIVDKPVHRKVTIEQHESLIPKRIFVTTMYQFLNTFVFTPFS